MGGGKGERASGEGGISTVVRGHSRPCPTFRWAEFSEWRHEELIAREGILAVEPAAAGLPAAVTRGGIPECRVQCCVGCQLPHGSTPLFCRGIFRIFAPCNTVCHTVYNIFRANACREFKAQEPEHGAGRGEGGWGRDGGRLGGL